MGVAPGSVRRPAGQSSLPAEILPGYSDSGRNTSGTGLAGDGGPGPGCGRAFDLLPVQVPPVRLPAVRYKLVPAKARLRCSSSVHAHRLHLMHQLCEAVRICTMKRTSVTIADDVERALEAYRR